MKCLFCDSKNIWLYPTKDGNGICKECIFLATISLAENTHVLREAKVLADKMVIAEHLEKR